MRDIQKTGATAGLYLRGMALADGDPRGLHGFLEAQHRSDRVAKAVLDALTKTDAPAVTVGELTTSAPAIDFVETMRPFSAVLQLPLRRTGFQTRTLSPDAMTASVVDELAPIPVSLHSFDDFTLNSWTKTAAIVALTKESAAVMNAAGETALAAELAAAVAKAEDQEFLSSISVGQTDFASAGTSIANLDADLKRALNDFSGDLRRAHWILAPRSAAAIGLLRGTGGAPAYPDVGAMGGTLLKLPVIVSEGAYDVESSPADASIFLVDPGRIAYADGGAQLTRSTAGALQLKTNPSNSATSVVSLFQTNSVALRALHYGAWFALSGAVVRINSCDL